MKLKVKMNHVATLFWAIAIFSYMFQSYYRSLSSLIVPCLGVYIILEISKFKSPNGSWMKIFIAFLLYLIGSIVYSMLQGNDINTAIRFFIILLVIPIAQNIQEQDFEVEWKIFKVLSLAKFATVCYTWIRVFISQDYWDYRVWAKANRVGDIYTVNGIPRVQLIGTSLFVMALVYSVMRTKRITLYPILMAVGAFMAGNAAYVLGIFFFIVLYYWKQIQEVVRSHNKWSLALIPITIIAMVIFLRFAIDTLQGKATFSNVVRQEQMSVLLDTNPIIGGGLGNSVFGDTTFRVYNGNNLYFELQTLYIYNQIGIIGLLFFYILTFSPYFGEKKKYKRMAYIVYLVYTFWNPYCFDSTHAATMLMITNLIPAYTDLDNHRSIKERLIEADDNSTSQRIQS